MGKTIRGKRRIHFFDEYGEELIRLMVEDGLTRKQLVKYLNDDIQVLTPDGKQWTIFNLDKTMYDYRQYIKSTETSIEED